jgi:hypothetical protein
MSDADELVAAFGAGTLLRPDADAPNFVDLARALATACGVPDLPLSPTARTLCQRFHASEHIVLLLADGLGLHQLEHGGRAAGLLLDHLALELRAVFPASTAVALTSLATGEWPAQHAITGWWTHLDVVGGAATVLPYRRRRDDRSLTKLGVSPDVVFPSLSLLRSMTRETVSLLPEAISDSVYTRYWTGDGPASGYRTPIDALTQTLEAVRHAPGPSLTYIYAPHVDHALHEHGTTSARAGDALQVISRLYEALVEELRGEATVVLTSDHGHLGAGPDDRLVIGEESELPQLLAADPAGDSRVLHFHVRAGDCDAFARRFRESFGSAFYLLTTEEVDELRLFGPEPLSATTAERLGDFVAISHGAQVLGYEPASGARELLRHESHHSGLRPEELRIPLLIAS